LELCKRLAENQKKNITFWFKAEAGTCSYISDKLKGIVIDLSGKISLEEFCAAISMCNLVITNDGGPFHIASFKQKRYSFIRSG
jgi:ADP-heptose:LPS heptosyltransferase